MEVSVDMKVSALNCIDLFDPDIPKSVALLKQACLDCGFFYVVNHGISQEFMDEVFAQSKRYFDLPIEEKMKVLRNEKHRGYTPVLDELLDPDNQVHGDYKEGYYIGVEVSEDDPQAEKPFYGPNRWPPEDLLPGWREIMEKYHREALEVARAVARIIALALDLNADYFDQPDMLGEPIATLRLLHYEGGVSNPSKGIFGAGAHSDYGLITLLASDDVIGLQICKNKDAQPQIWEYVSMVGALVENGYFDDGMELFRQMVEEGIKPNRVSVLNLAAGIGRVSDANEVYSVVVENGLDSDMCVQNVVMTMYSRCGRVDVARQIFDGILEKDLVCWSSMIESYARAGLPLEALRLFQQMKMQGVCPDYVIILSVINSCLNLGSLGQARFVHGLIIRSFFEGQLVIETALIDLYMKCGSINYARRIFDCMHAKNLISWSTIIAGYGMHGHAKDALKLFGQMKCSMSPDHITFVSLLSACSHAGLIAEGWQLFHSMTLEYGIVPRTEHYACMVDLLGRAGHLSEAQKFIESMPIKPDCGVWGALLGACRIHSNVELAELAAKSLLELDPENSGRYVILANIYQSLGKTEEANHIRGLMKRRRVKKTAGQTLIEVKNRVYKFHVGDCSNPQSDSIYRELERLMERIREEGYKPDTNYVLYDVEEEMKEKMLYFHSEKLAIVFGLLNSGPESTIRIMKNLRVCGDCHTATKFISRVTGREIIVRDSRRFHHFSKGDCSCGDYW